MQRKSMGHSRRKHGEQGAFDFNKRWRVSAGKPGPVNSGEVLPKGTMTGVPSAAATCMGPVSLVSSTRQSFSKAINSRSEVRPDRLLSVECGVRSADSIWFAISTSPRPPKINQVQFVLWRISFAAAIKRSTGQRLAGPYSAPGFKPKTGFEINLKGHNRVNCHRTL